MNDNYESVVRRDSQAEVGLEDKSMQYALLFLVAGSVVLLFLIGMGFRKYIMS